jgi:hypothetical protein
MRDRWADARQRIDASKAMAIPPKKTKEPTPQDEAVNAETPPKFAKLKDDALDALAEQAMEAFYGNRDIETSDADGRVWKFQPKSSETLTGLQVVAWWAGIRLGANLLPSSQVQCDDGQALVRTAIAVIAGAQPPPERAS